MNRRRLTTPIIRRATAADAEAIGDLTRTAYARWVPVLGREPRPMGVDYDDAVRRHRFDLLDDDEGLVALIETTPAADGLLIVNIAVRPDRQGQGLGRRLLTHAEALAREASLEVLRLYTNQRFTQNIRLYDSVGYRPEREERLDVGVVVHMIKRLAG